MQLRGVIRDQWDIVAACDSGGDCPLLDFLGSFEEPGDVEARKMMALIKWTSRYGPPKNKEKSNALGDDIFELKTTSFRVLYFFDQDRLIVCSHGFRKKTRRCPPTEKAFAVRVRRDYFQAKKQGGLVLLDERKGCSGE